MEVNEFGRADVEKAFLALLERLDGSEGRPVDVILIEVFGVELERVVVALDVGGVGRGAVQHAAKHAVAEVDVHLGVGNEESPDAIHNGRGHERRPAFLFVARLQIHKALEF